MDILKSAQEQQLFRCSSAIRRRNAMHNIMEGLNQETASCKQQEQDSARREETRSSLSSDRLSSRPTSSSVVRRSNNF